MSTTDTLLESISNIKARLVYLKRDRTKYLDSQNVIELYSELSKTLKGCDVDALLENGAQRKALTDLALIFSLALLTVGMTRQNVANFAIVLTIRSLLRYLTAEANYTPKEIGVLSARLTDAEQIYALGPTDPDLPYCPELSAIIGRMIRKCKALLSHVENTFEAMPEEERPIFSQVIHLRREILAAIVSPKFKPGDLDTLREKLERVDTHHAVTGAETGTGDIKDPLVTSQITSCIKFCEWFKDGPAYDPRVETIYKELLEMNQSLEVFLMTYRWTLRGTDLYQYMSHLVSLAAQLGQITGELGYEPTLTPHHLPKDVTLPYFLVRKCHAMIYKLLDNSEPVSEALSPIYNQLLTMKRCLIEVREMDGIANLRELYPYQMKLASLDNLRDNGKFFVDEEVPAGQGVLNALLAECYDLVYELKVDLEEREEAEGKDPDADVDDDDDDNDDGGDDDDESTCETLEPDDSDIRRDGLQDSPRPPSPKP